MILKILKKIKIQLILVIIITIFFLLSYIGAIPTIAELMIIVTNLFNKYGIIAVMICAFFENIAGFNLYFPGSIVILLSMAMAVGNPSRAFFLFLVIVLFSLLAHMFNYLVFRLMNLEKGGKVHPSTTEFFLSFWHPHFAAIVSIKSGASKMPFLSFLKKMLGAMLIWYTLWAFVMYYAGSLTIKKSYWGLVLLFLIYLFSWIILDVGKVISQDKKAFQK